MVYQKPSKETGNAIGKGLMKNTNNLTIFRTPNHECGACHQGHRHSAVQAQQFHPLAGHGTNGNDVGCECGDVACPYHKPAAIK